MDLLIVILVSLSGIAVLLVLIMLLVYVRTSSRLTRQLRQNIEEMERMLNDRRQTVSAPEKLDGSQGRDLTLLGDLLGSQDPHSQPTSNVPPMRIHVQAVPYPILPNMYDALSQRIDRWLLDHSFNRIGEFMIEEIDGELLRVYLSSDQRLVAAVRYQQHILEPYVEFCFDLGGGARGGVSNPPGSPIELPHDAVGKYYPESLSENFGLLSRMWLEAQELIDRCEVFRVEPTDVPQFFEDAHSAEMDFRIASGGVTAEEIRSSFTAQGVAVSTAEIEDIQQQWQEAIEQHLITYSNRGLKHQNLGHELLVVHEGSLGRYLLHRVIQKFDEMRECDTAQRQAMVGELEIMLKNFSPREAIARFRPLLPQPLRYQLIDQLERPVGTDLYALPNFCE